MLDMLNRVEFRTDQGVLLTLPLEDISDGYLIKGIDGLDPVKAVIVSSSFAQLDGEQYQASRREKRNIILRLGYEPDYSTMTVRQLRNRLYDFFMPKANVNMRFVVDGAPTLYISGRIESFDSPLFVKDPMATISILCFDSDFVDPTVQTFNGVTTIGNNEYQIEYDGTIESGFKLRLNVDRTMSDFTVFHRPLDNAIRTLDFVYPLVAGDVLEISTVSGNKYATLIRGGVTTSVLYGVSPYSNWINLFKGANNIRVFAEEAGVPFTIEYTTRYGGL